jgi:hypothetical protein
VIELKNKYSQVLEDKALEIEKMQVQHTLQVTGLQELIKRQKNSVIRSTSSGVTSRMSETRDFLSKKTG